MLNTGLAQDIVNRTMKIIPYNVNVMDAHGSILASGDPSRIGELHTGALLALAKNLTVEIDAVSARNMHGAQPGINLPLAVNGHVCGVVGLSGEPGLVRQFGELVRLTAEMILEQAQLTGELQRDSRYREAFVLSLIQPEQAGRTDIEAWARRLDIDLRRTQLVFLFELAEDLSAETMAMTEIQRLQLRLLTRQPEALCAALGARTMVILQSYDTAGAEQDGRAVPQQHLQALATIMREECQQPHTLTMGIALPGVDAAAISYQSARTASHIGRAREPHQTRFSYYEQALPVLLSGLDSGWRAQQLRLPMARLQAQDNSKQLLQRTVDAWFRHDGHPAATAESLHIHRNTLDYRLRRVAEITGLDLARIEDRFLLYASALLCRI